MPAKTRPRFFVNRIKSRGLEVSNCAIDIAHLVCDMVQSLTALLNELCKRCIVLEGRNLLDQIPPRSNMARDVIPFLEILLASNLAPIFS